MCIRIYWDSCSGLITFHLLLWLWLGIFMGTQNWQCWQPIKTFLKKFFGGHESFLWGHWYPYFGLLVTFSLGFKARVGSLIRAWQRHTCYTFPEIHLWCNTCWPLCSQDGSWATSSIYLRDIGGTGNRVLSAAHSVRSGRPDALPTELSRLGITN